MFLPPEKLTSLDDAFHARVNELEKRLPGDYRVTSTRREPDHNARIGGVPDSAHVKGLALDVAHDGDIIKAMQLAYWVGRLGFVRVEFADRHLHFDIDDTKPQVQWVGKSK